MKNSEAKALIGKIITIKEVSNDMNGLVEELKKLPKGQLKKLQGNESITSILGKYGVDI